MDGILGIAGKAAVMLVTLEAVRWIYVSHRFNCMSSEIDKVATELMELKEDINKWVEFASKDD